MNMNKRVKGDDEAQELRLGISGRVILFFLVLLYQASGNKKEGLQFGT